MGLPIQEILREERGMTGDMQEELNTFMSEDL
jgi:hypothetical protein